MDARARSLQHDLKLINRRKLSFSGWLLTLSFFYYAIRCVSRKPKFIFYNDRYLAIVHAVKGYRVLLEGDNYKVQI